MQLKCNFCDPTLTKIMQIQGIKPTKSINTEIDNYVKDEKNKYYHVECYLQHLMKSKKMSEKEARDKLEIRLKIVQAEIKEMKERDKFYQWIKNYYDTALPSYYCTKISEIVSGTHEKVNEAISYSTLLDIYEKMAVYLKKQGNNKNFKISQKMNYDLAIILGNYGDYKKFKEKQKQDELSKNDVEKKINESIKYKESMENREIKEKDEFNLIDVMDDLLL